METLFWLIVLGVGGWYLYKRATVAKTSATPSASMSEPEATSPLGTARQPPESAPNLPPKTSGTAHPKVLEVLSHVSKEYFTEFTEVDTNHFCVTTQLTKLFEHETYFRFEINGDVLRFEIRHFLGFLDEHSTFDDVINILKENDRSLGTTSCYACLHQVGSNKLLYVSLQNNHAFLLKWESADIAEMINLQFYDLKMSAYLLFKRDPPVAPAIKVFGPVNPRNPKQA